MARPAWTAQCTNRKLIGELLPVRRRESHKGDYGRVLLLCGSEGLTGAARLAAKAALRTGSGLVYLGVPEKIYPIIAAGAGSEIVFPLPCDEAGRLCMAAMPAITARLPEMDAVLLGPGLGRSEELTRLVQAVLSVCRVPLVLDADGINAAAPHIDVLRGCACPVVLTPHDGEFLRLGGDPKAADRTLDELKQAAALPHLHIEGVFMHFCVADSRAEEDVSFTKLQYKRFMDMLSAMEGAGIKPELRHCCNSGATILYPEFALDMVRPGIITYGNAPSEELEGAISLRPMMSLHSMIAQVRTVPAGTDISYGRLYRTTHDTRVAVLPIGYADGLSRLLTGKASFYLQGKLVPVIGRICMDMCMLDVSEVPDAKPGDIVTIFGYDDDGTLVPCERLAAAQGTINYELLCQISKRIPRICHRGAETSQILQYIV